MNAGRNRSALITTTFHATDEILQFVDFNRQVPGRLEGRKPEDREIFCLGVLLKTIAPDGLIAYPLTVDKGESPDFMLLCPSGERVGLEVTEATTGAFQKMMTCA